MHIKKILTALDGCERKLDSEVLFVIGNFDKKGGEQAIKENKSYFEFHNEITHQTLDHFHLPGQSD